MANWKSIRGRRFPTDDTVEAEVQKWLREQDVSSYRQGSENLIVYHEVPELVLKSMWKNAGLMSNDIRVLFLSPLTSIHVKKGEPYFSTSLV
jgi:hypothetical protein